VTRFDDPVVVRAQYATEENLRARQALWANVEGENAPIVLRRVLSAQRPRKVLEVGGGQGELAEWLRGELSALVTFVDQSERMVELARARGVSDAHVGDVQALPFADESFDLAVAAWMLYHVHDLDRGLAELARVLEPGGKLVAVTNSVRHLEELGDLLGEVMPGFELQFNAENGEQILCRHFSDVARIDAEVVAIVESRDVLVRYAESVSYDTDPIPDDVSLPFRVHGRTTIFVATR
jgi:SAM-dependent methyltransferase